MAATRAAAGDRVPRPNPRSRSVGREAGSGGGDVPSTRAGRRMPMTATRAYAVTATTALALLLLFAASPELPGQVSPPPPTPSPVPIASPPTWICGFRCVAPTYVKASQGSQFFGHAVALSRDGQTLAIGAPGEYGDAPDLDDYNTGAVYVFARSGYTWVQQARITASNAEFGDEFGDSVALSADGNTLVVGATGEASSATGIDGDQGDNSASYSGAVYVFTRERAETFSTGFLWTQSAYIKASNTGGDDRFGFAVALS